MAHVYEKLKQFLDAHQLDPDEVSVEAGIPKRDFHAMLTGKRKIYADELKSICLALHVSASTFVEWKNNEKDR